MSTRVVHLRHKVLAVLFVFVASFGVANSAEARSDASASIINGNMTEISKWPWQIAIAYSSSSKPDASPFMRTFCGGSVVAPTVVLTATHCALDMRKADPPDFVVITGRTNLNDGSDGAEVPVSGIRFPRTSGGTIRFQVNRGWDVALLKLSEPVAATPVKLIGADEAVNVKPGTRLVETGWGSIIKGKDVYPLNLRKGGTNIQPGSICRAIMGARNFKGDLQFCFGDADGRQANCYGDSGGPAVVATTAGYRQVGVTSSGTANDCGGRIPNVDVRLDAAPIRKWIRATTLKLSGTDPVGSGGTVGKSGPLASMPKVRGKTAGQARKLLRRNGFRKIRVTRNGRGNRVSAQPVPRGWLWNPKKPIRLLVRGW